MTDKFLIQGSHRLEKYLNLEGFLKKTLKIKSALKSTGKPFKSFERTLESTIFCEGGQWLSGRELDSRPKGLRVRASSTSLCCGLWARHIYPSLVLVQPKKTRPCLTERLLMGRKESNQTKLFSVWFSTVDRDLNQYKIVVPLFGAAYAAPNNDTMILY